MPGILTLCHSGLVTMVLHAVAPPPVAVTAISGRVLDGAGPVLDAVVTLEPLASPWPLPRLPVPDSELDRLPALRKRPSGRFFLATGEALLPQVLVAAPGESVGLLRECEPPDAVDLEADPPVLQILG